MPFRFTHHTAASPLTFSTHCLIFETVAPSDDAFLGQQLRTARANPSLPKSLRNGLSYVIATVIFAFAPMRCALAQPITNDTLSILPTKTLRVTGEYGRPYVLELTDQLSSAQTWSTFTNFVMPDTGEFLQSDPANGASSNRFYRLKRDSVLADSVAE